MQLVVQREAEVRLPPVGEWLRADEPLLIEQESPSIAPELTAEDEAAWKRLTSIPLQWTAPSSSAAAPARNFAVALAVFAIVLLLT